MSWISLPRHSGSVVAEFVWHHSIARSRKPPTRHKYLSDISHTSWVIAHFVSNVVAMATRVSRGSICVTLFNSPTPKTPCWTQRSPIYLVYKLSYSRFCLISLPWQWGLVVVKFDWHHSIARPRKPPAIAKDLGDISYIGRVIADFVLNFVAVATGVGRGRICLA